MNSKKLINGGHTSNKGITLIALVITIIVLLILAGVTISMVLGDDGIIAQAQGAKTAQEDAIFEDVYNQYLAAEKVKAKTEGGEVDKKSALEKTARDLGIEDEFNITEEYVEYNGDNNKIKELINSEINYNEIREAGYIISTVNGKPYLTGVVANNETKSAETVKSLKDKIGNGYTVWNGENEITGEETDEEGNKLNILVATGDILRKAGQEDITIVVKGDVNSNRCYYYG